MRSKQIFDGSFFDSDLRNYQGNLHGYGLLIDVSFQSIFVLF